MPKATLTINRYQRLLIVVAFVDILVMLLFPPFKEFSLALGVPPAFDGFHPLLGRWGQKPIDGDLLTIQLFFVLTNGLAAFLFLRGESGKPFNYTIGIAGFVGANAAVVLLFPPFEPYPGLFRSVGSTFDSFNFILGGRVGRPIFAPMLYLECVFIAVNALTLWLLFNTVRRTDDAGRAKREKLLALADDLDDQQIDRLTSEIRGQSSPKPAAKKEIGRKTERRRGANPNYRGPERRKGVDRRQH